jgi:hypothetical protein
MSMAPHPYAPAPLSAPVDYSPNIIMPRDKEGERRWALTLFSITTVLLFADQNLLVPNLTAITEVGPSLEKYANDRVTPHAAECCSHYLYGCCRNLDLTMANKTPNWEDTPAKYPVCLGGGNWGRYYCVRY